ncbi:MAG: serine hydrolase domain-containing protein [Maribacter sp.]
MMSLPNIKIWRFLIVVAFLAPFGHAQKPSDIDGKIWIDLNNEIDQFMEEGNVPALSIAFVKDGQVTFINKGNFSRESTDKISENAIFQIASISKMLTSVMINSLLIKGDLKLNASIVTYLPKDYPEKTLKKLRPITIRDLLHHRSGLPGSTKTYRKHRKGNEAFIYNYTEEDFRNDLNSVRMKSKVGEKYYYSNFGYALLGYIAELATKKTFEQLIKEYLQDAYSLASTSPKVMDSGQLVAAYRKDKRQDEIKPWVMGKLTPPSGLFSSTNDLAKLMLFQLKAYETGASNPLVLTNDTRICQPESGVKYGYGFRVYGGSGVYGHGGEMDGFAGDYSINPKKNMGYVILTSCAGDEVYKLSRRISGILY